MTMIIEFYIVHADFPISTETMFLDFVDHYIVTHFDNV